MKEKNLVLDKSFQFALDIIRTYSFLKENHEYVLSKQLLRSGTSIGANIEEALAGISRRDFIAKLSISQKEARETRYWLRLLDKSQVVIFDYYSDHLKEIESLINILTAIVKTSQEKPLLSKTV